MTGLVMKWIKEVVRELLYGVGTVIIGFGVIFTILSMVSVSV
jgi:hypothetical protein